jgi:uncharacterized protein (TIGR00251 family)
VLGALSPSGTDTVVSVYVQPRASRTAPIGMHDGHLKIALAAPPVDGAANKALCKALATWLGCARRDIAILSGDTSRRKRVRIQGMTPDELVRRLMSR